MKSSNLIAGGIILSLIIGAFSYFHFKDKREKALLIAKEEIKKEQAIQAKEAEKLFCSFFQDKKRLPSNHPICLNAKVIEIIEQQDKWIFIIETEMQDNNQQIIKRKGRATFQNNQLNISFNLIKE